jgi:hypothetical protein
LLLQQFRSVESEINIGKKKYRLGNGGMLQDVKNNFGGVRLRSPQTTSTKL